MALDAERRADARLSSGEISSSDLSKENGILSPDRLRGVKLVRSGRRVPKSPRVLVA